MQAGFFGKHPAFGDFIAHGLPVPLREEMEAWLTPALAKLRQQAGKGWEHLYDTARPVRFWIGPRVLRSDSGALRGVIHVSRDSVGRRYPLVMVVSEASPAPPPIAPDQALYDGLEQMIVEAMPREAKQPQDLMALEGLGQAPEPETDTLWAVNPQADPAEILHAMGAADYARAAAGRSYWWSAHDGARAAAVWVCPGLPDAAALGWLLAGVRPAPVESSAADGETPFAGASDAVASEATEDRPS